MEAPQLNWRYYFPIDTAGNGQYAFAPNSASVDGNIIVLLAPMSPPPSVIQKSLPQEDFERR